MKCYLLLLALLLCACTSTPKSSAERQSNAPQAIAVTKPGSLSGDSKIALPTDNNVYELQHVLIPHWTYNSDGQFYAELQAGDTDKLKEVATKLISKEYAEGITVKPLASAVLIVFPTPEKFTECFFVLIVKKDQEFTVYTYEKTLNLEGLEEVKGVVGGWSKNKEHLNYGPRGYSSAADFAADMLPSAK